MIVNHQFTPSFGGPRLAALFRHRDEKTATASPLESSVLPRAKSRGTNCDARNPFRFRFLAPSEAEGYENCRVAYPSASILASPLTLPRKKPFANPLFSLRYALFQVPYPVTPLFATLTKTAGCIPTIPILELNPLRPPALSPTPDPLAVPSEAEGFPFFSYSCALFCTHQNHNPFIFMRFRTLCTKQPGVGVPSIPPLATQARCCRLASPRTRSLRQG